jgi:hypothetical protein
VEKITNNKNQKIKNLIAAEAYPWDKLKGVRSNLKKILPWRRLWRVDLKLITKYL